MSTTSHSEGRLFYIVGASGSGKDSLIRRFREIASERKLPVLTAHRYITRRNTADEGSVYLSDAEFAQREQNALFAMSWHANGLSYGIGIEIDHWLKAGFSVVVNGSRAYLPEAQKTFGSQLHSILIDVPDDVLTERLYQRGREDDATIARRLERHRSLSGAIACDSTIQNIDSVDVGASVLCELIVSNLSISNTGEPRERN